MNDGPIILTHGVMEEKLTKRNFIFGGTHSANRVCRSNPAWYGKCIHLYRRHDWHLARVPYGLRRRQRHWNNTAGALIKATSYFHHHASEDICIAALPKGTLIQQIGLPRHQHNETWCVNACVRVREGTHRKTHFLSFPKPPGSEKTLKDSPWWGWRWVGTVSEGCTKGIHKGKYSLCTIQPGLCEV